VELKFSYVARAAVGEVNAVARWLGGDGVGAAAPALARLVGAVRVVAVGAAGALDPHAAWCEVRVAGAAVRVGGASGGVRAIAQRVLGGPSELAAPRPLTMAERAVWTLVVAAAIADLGVAGQAWPLEAAAAAPRVAVEVVMELGAITVWLDAPAGLLARAAPRPGAWTARAALDGELVVARCALPATAVDALAVGDVIVVERAAGGLELVIGDGAVALAAAPGAVVAAVASGYGPRDMALPDDAHVELAVTLGTTRLTVRQLSELAVGVTVPLGRAVGGPFELRAGGRVIGRGELVDIDGELGVRVVSLGDST
jgi:hypothetical protein